MLTVPVLTLAPLAGVVIAVVGLTAPETMTDAVYKRFEAELEKLSDILAQTYLS